MNPNAIDVEHIRADIPAVNNIIYLNTGTFGPMPRAVSDEIRRVYSQIEELGTNSPLVFQDLELKGVEETRAKVAGLIHATPAEIALTRNVTDGINIVLHGLDWSPGDEIIISDQEHTAGTIPWLALAERRGVVVRLLRICYDRHDLVAQFESLINARTRLACLSHVSCLSGFRLPIAQLCHVARDAGVLTLIDGAHAEGQFPVIVPAIGVDFYAACGHKWLLGPQGTGFLYVRRELLMDLRPSWLGWGTNKVFDRKTMCYELESSAARFEQSTQPWPLFLALGQAVDFIQEVGLANIEERVRWLVDHFRRLLAEIPGLRFITPDQRALSSGLLTCSVSGWDALALSQYLWQSQQILVNRIQEFDALRFSVAFFNTKEELATVAAIIKAASRPKGM